MIKSPVFTLADSILELIIFLLRVSLTFVVSAARISELNNAVVSAVISRTKIIFFMDLTSDIEKRCIKETSIKS